MRLDSKHKTRLVATFGAAAALTLGATSIATAYGSPATSGEKQEVREVSAQADGAQGLSTQGLDTQALEAKLETMATQSTSTIAPGESRTAVLEEGKRCDFVFECKEDGLYTLSAAEGEDAYVEYVVVSDVESKKPITYSYNGALSFSAEAGRRYLLSTTGYGSHTVSLAMHDSYKGSESFRVTKVNGSAAPEAHDPYTPITPGDTVELAAEIPLWQLVSTDAEGHPYVASSPSVEYGEKLLADEEGVLDIEVSLGGQPLEKGEGKDYVAEASSRYYSSSTEIALEDAGQEKLAKAFSEDPNATLVITATARNVAEPMEGSLSLEGMDGYPSWAGSNLGESEEMVYYGPRISYLTLSYASAFDEREVRINRLLLNNALDLLALVTDGNGSPVRLEPKTFVDEETGESRVAEFTRDGADAETYVVYLERADGTRVLPEDTEVISRCEGWRDALGILTSNGCTGEELEPVCFPNVTYGTYTLVCERKNGDEKPEVTKKQISVAQDASEVTDENEMGLQVEYDGAEVPFHCYGRLLGVGEGGSSTSNMPSMPFGTINGAVVTLPAPQEVGPVAMKVERDDGTLADARTAAFGETVNFRTTAKFAADDSHQSESAFTYTFPDTCFDDDTSGSTEAKRPFEVSAADVRVKATLADGTTLELQAVDPEDDEAYGKALSSDKIFFTAEYEKQDPWYEGYPGNQMLTIRIIPGDGAQDALKGATATIDVPAKLTTTISCGGYGNVVGLQAEVDGEYHNDVNVVYTGTFILQTIDTAGNPLDGAEFTIGKEGAGDLKVGAVKGLSLHAVPEAVFTGDDNASNLKMVGHAAEETNGLEGESVGQGTGCLSYAGVEPGVYNLTETKFPQGGWRPREMPQPIRLELTAHVPDTIVSGTEYCRWSVRLDGTSLPELLRYQMGLLDPALPDEAYLGSFIAYSCQSSTIVLRELHVQNDITAQVVWNDEGLESERPTDASLQLYRNGTGVGESVLADDAEAWSHIWEKLESEKGALDQWSVAETNDWSVSESDLSAQSAGAAESRPVQSGISTQARLSAQSGISTAEDAQRKYLTTYSGLEYAYDEESGRDSATITVTNTPIMRVTFDSAGGNAVEEQGVARGNSATAPAEPTRDGYTFEGWFLNESAYDFSSAVDEDVTLVAHWKKNEAEPEQKDDPQPGQKGEGTPEQKGDSKPEKKGEVAPEQPGEKTPSPAADGVSTPASAPKAAPRAATKATLPRTGDPAGIAALGGGIGGALVGIGGFARILRRRRR